MTDSEGAGEGGGSSTPVRRYVVRTISWTGSPSVNVLVYEIYRSPGTSFNAGSAILYDTVAAGITDYDVTFQYFGPGALAAGTKFTYAIRARSIDYAAGGALRSDFSDPVTLTVQACP